MQTISQDSQKIRKAIQVNNKTKAKYSKSFYAKTYLGLEVPQHQYDWYENVGKYLKDILLAPRDHGKTTSIPRVIAEHDTLYNQGFNILLLSKTYKQANKTLDVIEADLKNNPRIRQDFNAELQDLRRKDNQLFYNLGDKVRRDATIEATGILSDVTGGHFNKIIMDDIFDDVNTCTKSGREKVMKTINGTILPLLEPGCNLLGIGTRKHPEDGYQEMINNPAWHVVEQKAILQWPKNYEYIKDKAGVIVDVDVSGDYKVLWPNKWGIKELLLQLAAMGTVIFNREYQNDAAGMMGKVFKPEWLGYYAILEENQNDIIKGCPPLETMEIYQGVDLAIKKGEKNDFFCCETIGVTHNPFKIWILDWHHDQLSFPEQVKVYDKLFYGPLTPIWNGLKWNVLRVGIESNAYQIALAQQLLDEANYPIEEIISIKNKETRIRAGSVDYENDLVMVPADHPKYPAFLNEYASFDEGEHDDILDADDIVRRLILKRPEPEKKADLEIIQL